MPSPMYTWGRFETRGPKAMTSDTTARMTATQTPAPTKAWPKDVSRWAYQPGSPFAVSAIWFAMEFPVRLNGNIQMSASNSQMAAHTSNAPVPPKRPRAAADDSVPTAWRSAVSSDFGHTIRPRRM